MYYEVQQSYIIYIVKWLITQDVPNNFCDAALPHQKAIGRQ